MAAANASLGDPRTRTLHVEKELDKLDHLLEFTKGKGLIIAADSNSRSAAWHDTQTIKRRKTLEEYIISKNLYIMKERSERTTFRNRRGKSNIDLTIVNNSLLKALRSWEIWDEKSCSDHSIIKFYISQCNKRESQHSYKGTRYTINEQNYDRFDNLKKNCRNKISIEQSKEPFRPRQRTSNTRKNDQRCRRRRRHNTGSNYEDLQQIF